MTLQIYYTDNIWNFPRWVAKQKSYFDKYGLSVKLIEQATTETESGNIFKRKNVRLFEQGEIDLYSTCEWGTIKRAAKHKKGKIVAQRAVSENIPYSIYVSEDEITSTEDLSNVPVAMKNHSGSHYATIEMLERSLDQDRATTVHIGRPVNRLAALVSGEVSAATLMGPMIAAAEAMDLNCISMMPAGGAFVGHNDLEQERIELFIQALNEAVKDINNNPESHLKHVVDMMVSELQNKNDLRRNLNLSTVEDQITVPQYDQLMSLPNIDEVDRKLQWMQDHDLISSKVEIKEIVRSE
jgi:ABC-type nitrate/sulfonate/bicarbonate transport system substrate-binding protein